MRGLQVICFFILSINMSYGQIGVFTERPLGIFHIDGKGDNAIVETPTQLLNDVIIQSDGLGGVNIGIGGQPYMSNQLDLQDPNKAMLINRVELQSRTDITAIPNPQQGMLVYNTQISGLDVVPGIYIYNGNSWDYLEVDDNNGLMFLNMQESVSSTASNGSTTVGGGAPLTIGDKDEDGSYSVTISETGSYSFEFRLNGTADYKPDQSNVYYYLGVFKNDVLQDLAEMDIQVGGIDDDGSMAPESITYTITMGCQAVAGDKITFRLSHYTTTLFSWTLTGADTSDGISQTTMIYWKL